MLNIYFTEGSSFIQNGTRYGHRGQGWGATGVVDLAQDSVVWAAALPPGTLTQKAELIALTQALKLAEGAKVNIYTDSRHAFATAHVHGSIPRNGIIDRGRGNN